MSRKTKSSTVSSALADLNVLNGALHSKRQELEEVERLISQSSSLARETETMKEGLKEVSDKKKSIETSIALLQQQHEAEQAKLDKLSADIADASEVRKSIEWDIEKAKGALVVQEEKKKKVVAEKKAELDLAKRELKSVESQSEKEKNVLADWNRKVSNASLQFEAFKVDELEAEALKSSIEERKKAVKAENSELKKLDKKLSEVQGKISKAQEKLSDVKDQQSQQVEILEAIKNEIESAAGHMSLREEWQKAREIKFNTLVTKVEKQLGKKINI